MISLLLIKKSKTYVKEFALRYLQEGRNFITVGELFKVDRQTVSG